MNRFSLVLGTGGLLEEGYVDVQILTASYIYYIYEPRVVEIELESK